MSRRLTAADRSALIRLASTLPTGDETRRAILAGLGRVATEFPTQEALDKYLKDHPGADKSKHTVKKQDGGGGKGKEDKPKRKAEHELRSSVDTTYESALKEPQFKKMMDAAQKAYGTGSEDKAVAMVTDYLTSRIEGYDDLSAKEADIIADRLFEVVDSALS